MAVCEARLDAVRAAQQAQYERAVNEHRRVISELPDLHDEHMKARARSRLLPGLLKGAGASPERRFYVRFANFTRLIWALAAQLCSFSSSRLDRRCSKVLESVHAASRELRSSSGIPFSVIFQLTRLVPNIVPSSENCVRSLDVRNSSSDLNTVRTRAETHGGCANL